MSLRLFHGLRDIFLNARRVKSCGKERRGRVALPCCYLFVTVDVTDVGGEYKS